MQTTALTKERCCNVKHSEVNSASFWGLTTDSSHLFFGGSRAYPVPRLLLLKEFKGSTPPVLWLLYNLYAI